MPLVRKGMQLKITILKESSQSQKNKYYVLFCLSIELSYIYKIMFVYDMKQEQNFWKVLRRLTGREEDWSIAVGLQVHSMLIWMLLWNPGPYQKM